MSFLPTAFLSFFGDERERERLKKACPFLRERGGCSKEEEKFKKVVERHGMDLKS